ncbi:hypothetical protein L1987_61820 [Smallanthus sonchifolius]|uniref:Uncharacterized protein n=1 Tax=Smallanthus sonchifolius TaxID=185202 RepID=A0ACB9C8T7_9ASTR|nr:hypothetical protein L1987_61820 [Smallanthus sonchifolius]
MGLKRRAFFFVLVTAIMLLVTGMNATRVLKVDPTVLGKHGLWNQLPRGPVPPSGPSLCHNMIGPFKQSQFENMFKVSSKC